MSKRFAIVKYFDTFLALERSFYAVSFARAASAPNLGFVKNPDKRTLDLHDRVQKKYLKRKSGVGDSAFSSFHKQRPLHPTSDKPKHAISFQSKHSTGKHQNGFPVRRSSRRCGTLPRG